MILAGDIGGTKTELALFEDVKTRKIVIQQSFPSQKHKSLEEIIAIFIPKNHQISHACFGVAGPIESNRCHTTNLPWIVDGSQIQKNLDVETVSLINDLEANAWGIEYLKEEELYTLAHGNGVGNQALISAGTGLGEAGLYFDGKHHIPFASEGGHCNFAPTDEEEEDLLRYLRKKYGHVSYERILCGKGFLNLYQFYVDEKKEKGCEEVEQKFSQEDPAKVIQEYAKNGKCPICKKVMKKFSSIYGSEAGNVALKFLSLGGLYIGGGIAPKMIEYIQQGDFLRSFIEKGRFKNLLSSIKIQVILNQHTALLGAARFVEYTIQKVSSK